MVFLRSILTVSAFTSLSRILGFARDLCIASFLGSGPIADAFFIAFKMPNLFRRLFAEGAFNASFIPLFNEHLIEQGKKGAISFAARILSIMVIFLFLFITIVQIFMPWLMYLFAPGFSDDPEKFSLAVNLTRLTFPYLLFICLVSLLGGVLNSLGRFAAVAATPIILNLVLILALLIFSPYLPSGGHALSWGVAFAGIIQFLWLLNVSRKEGIYLPLHVPRFTPQVRRFLKLVLPGIFGAGVVQINLLVDLVIASFLPTGAISFLYYADRVNQLPLGIVGVAIGTAILPLLSQQIRKGDEKGALESLNRGIEFALLLALPATAAFLLISDLTIVVFFQRGAFGAKTSLATAQALMAYALGLPAYILIKIMAPGFFARGDTITPVKIAVVCVIINVFFNLTLVHILGHVGIALATAISAWVNVSFLFIVLSRRGHYKLDQRLRFRFKRIIFATAGMSALLWGGLLWLKPYFEGGQTTRILFLSVLVVGGLCIYLALAVFLGATSKNFMKMLKTS